MPRIMLAIPKGALTIFPRLSPVNGGKPHQKGPWGKIFHECRKQLIGNLRTPFERVLLRRVMVKAGGQRGIRKPPDQQVALGGMQVAAGGIATKRPTRVANLLPRGKGKGIFKQSR